MGPTIVAGLPEIRRNWLLPVYRDGAIVPEHPRCEAKMTDPLLSSRPLATADPRPRQTGEAALRQLSVELESSFLSEMLGLAGLGQVSDSFGGGIGEEQFASFLRQEQADAMVRKGGIGLAESLFRALTEGRDDH
jgi:hypothetical protein